MDEKFMSGSGVRYLATLGWVVVVVAGMRAAEPLLVPLLLSVFLAFICAPLVLWLERKGVHAAFSVLLVILGVLLVGIGMGAVAGTSLSQFSLAMPRYQDHLRKEISSFLSWLQAMGVSLSDEDLFRYVDPGAAMRFGVKMLSGIGGILTNSFLILLTVMFILFEASTFRKKLLAIWGTPEGSLGRFTKFADDVYHFLAIKTAVSLGTGILVAIWVAVVGVDYPLLWGLLAFLLNYVPNLGSIIAGAPAVLLGFIQFGMGRALVVALGYVVINLLVGTVLEPRLMGRRLGLSTLTVFLSLVFWGWVLGPVGMVLSVPLTMILKIALESSDGTRWMAILLGSHTTVEEAAPVPSSVQGGEKG